ncbi:MAG: hypothetical protein IPK26_08515 [Planctomycetes bacterium]|nr:hypothetical protein [Planctomycetota bacterium]
MRNPLRIAVLAVALTASAGAQTPTPAVALEHVSGLQPTMNGYLAFGHGYLTRFESESVEFTPMLGERVARDMPLRWSLRSIRRGETPIAVPTRGVKPTRIGDSVCWHRDSVLERYEVRADAIEQSFVFEKRLAGAGDLIVTCDLETELAAETRADGTLMFAADGAPAVLVGQVYGIDAAGNRADGALRCRGRQIELVLPAGFVDTAVFPLTLDPTYASPIVASNAAIDDHDVAYDVTTDSYLIVWTRDVSAANTHVFGARIPSGSQLATGLVIDASNGVASHPRVGNVNARDQFFVAWQHAAVRNVPTNIRGTAVGAATGTVQTPISIAATADDEQAPVVAGDSTTSDDEAIVAWRTPNGIFVQQVSIPATLIPALIGSPVTVISGGTDDLAISKAADGASRLSLAWSFQGALSRDLAVRGLTRNLTLLGSTLILGSSVLDETAPALGTGMLAYERESSTIGTPHRDIACALIDETAAGVTLRASGIVVAGGSGDEHAPDLARLGNRHALVWASTSTTGVTTTHAQLLADDRSPCNSRVALPATGSSGPGTPRLASATLFDIARNDSMISFTAPGSSARDLFGQRFESLGRGFPFNLELPANCGQGGVQSLLNPPFVIGNEAFGFAVSGLPAGTATFLVIGYHDGSISPCTNCIFCGTCTLTTPVSMEFVPQFGGIATRGFPTPCDPIYLGTTLETQWLSFGSAATVCPQAPGLTASSRMRHILWN